MLCHLCALWQNHYTSVWLQLNDLSRDGFIETVAGKGTFVSTQNKDFLREENLRLIEEKLEEVVETSKMAGIELPQLIEILTLFYKGD